MCTQLSLPPLKQLRQKNSNLPVHFSLIFLFIYQSFPAIMSAFDDVYCKVLWVQKRKIKFSTPCKIVMMQQCLGLRISSGVRKPSYICANRIFHCLMPVPPQVFQPSSLFSAHICFILLDSRAYRQSCIPHRYTHYYRDHVYKHILCF